ncbi:MAG: hypothetical protein WC480_02370 [Patescibacteria group bacterium]
MDIHKKIIRQLVIGPFNFTVERLGRRYRVRYKYNRKHLIADLILGLAVVSLILINVFISFIFTKWVVSLQVKLDISVSQPVLSGAKTIYTVYYHNSSRSQELTAARIVMNLPADFVFIKANDERYDPEKHILLIGDLPPKTGGQLELTGEVWAPYQTKQKVIARLDYYQQAVSGRDMNWFEERTAQANYQVEGSVLDLKVEAPLVVASNSPFDFYLVIQNNYSQPLNNIKLIPQWSSDFTLINSDTQVISGAWSLATLEAGETKAIKVRGKINSDKAESPVKVKTTFQVFCNHQEQPLLANQAVLSTNIFYPKFLVAALVNGLADYSPLPGEEVEYLIKYSNQENQTIENVNITLDLSDPLYNVSTFSTEQSISLTGKTLILNPDNFPDLARLEPGQGGEVKFKIKTQTKTIGSESPAYLTLVPKVNYTLEFQGQKTAFDAELSPINNIMTTNLELVVLARYYTLEGEQLGIGPLPPVVGVETKYWIMGKILNSYNDVTDIRVSGTLPNNVTWLAKESVGQGASQAFDVVTREISWQPGEVAKFAGDLSIAPQAGFAVILTPRVDQIGRLAPLIQDIKITGKDKITGRIIEKYVGTVTTDLYSDKRASNQGGKVVDF